MLTFCFDDMSKTYNLWNPHIVMYIKSNYSRSFTVAEELFFQSFPMPSKITPNAGVTLSSNFFLFNSYITSCHTILIWKISWYIIKPVIFYHPFPAPYYTWDAENMWTKKVSKIPPFDGNSLMVMTYMILRHQLFACTIYISIRICIHRKSNDVESWSISWCM